MILSNLLLFIVYFRGIKYIWLHLTQNIQSYHIIYIILKWSGKTSQSCGFIAVKHAILIEPSTTIEQIRELKEKIVKNSVLFEKLGWISNKHFQVFSLFAFTAKCNLILSLKRYTICLVYSSFSSRQSSHARNM